MILYIDDLLWMDGLAEMAEMAEMVEMAEMAEMAEWRNGGMAE